MYMILFVHTLDKHETAVAKLKTQKTQNLSQYFPSVVVGPKM